MRIWGIPPPLLLRIRFFTDFNSITCFKTYCHCFQQRKVVLISPRAFFYFALDNFVKVVLRFLGNQRTVGLLQFYWRMLGISGFYQFTLPLIHISSLSLRLQFVQSLVSPRGFRRYFHPLTHSHAHSQPGITGTNEYRTLFCIHGWH